MQRANSLALTSCVRFRISRLRGIEPRRAVDDDGLALPQRTPGEIVEYPSGKAMLSWRLCVDTTASAGLKRGLRARLRGGGGWRCSLASLEDSPALDREPSVTRCARLARGVTAGILGCGILRSTR